MGKKKEETLKLNVNDFIGGTHYFSDAAVGKYVRLLFYQFKNGAIPEHHMNFICRQSDDRYDDPYDAEIVKKFVRNADGSYENERLKRDIEKDKAFAASRSSNRLNGLKNKVQKVSHEASYEASLDTVMKPKKEVKTIYINILDKYNYSNIVKEKLIILFNEKKWKNKSEKAYTTTLDKLKQFNDDDFIIELIDAAIIGNYQGLIFPDTKKKFQIHMEKKGVKINRIENNEDDYTDGAKLK